MANQVVLPKLSDMENEGTVSEWLVAVGERVEVGTPLVAMEMNKAVVDVESTVAGTVVNLLARIGDTVQVGQPLVELE